MTDFEKTVLTELSDIKGEIRELKVYSKIWRYVFSTLYAVTTGIFLKKMSGEI